MKTAGISKLVKYSLIMLAMAVLVLIAGYVYRTTGNVPNEETEVAKIVRAYNEKLIEALQTLDVARIKEYVTEKQSRSDELLLAYYKEKALIREFDQLAELKIDKVTINKDTAVVITSEIWEVKQENLKTKQINDMGEVRYSTTYSFVKQNGKWLVDSVKALESNGKK